MTYLLANVLNEATRSVRTIDLVLVKVGVAEIGEADQTLAIVQSCIVEVNHKSLLCDPPSFCAQSAMVVVPPNLAIFLLGCKQTPTSYGNRDKSQFALAAPSNPAVFSTSTSRLAEPIVAHVRSTSRQ